MNQRDGEIVAIEAALGKDLIPVTARLVDRVQVGPATKYDLFLADSGGKVGAGLGGRPPVAMLEVADNTTGDWPTIAQLSARSAGSIYSLHLGYHTSAAYGFIQSQTNTVPGDLAINPNGGDVGIGSTTPTDKLQVTAGATNTATLLFGASDPAARRRPQLRFYKWAGTVNDQLVWRWNVGQSGGADGSLDVGFAEATSVGGTETFTERLVITRGGTVGIGTTSPNLVGNLQRAVTISAGTSGNNVKAGLELKGSRNGPSNFAHIGFHHQANLVAEIRGVRGSAADAGEVSILTTPAGGALTERVRVHEGGNVGIGTTQPTAPLDVHSNISASGGGDVATVSGAISGSAWTFRRSTQDYLFLRGFNTSGVETIRLDPSTSDTFFNAGNVGIGTTSPTAPLHVAGDTIRIEGTRSAIPGPGDGNIGDITWVGTGVRDLYVKVAVTAWKEVELVSPRPTQSAPDERPLNVPQPGKTTPPSHDIFAHMSTHAPQLRSDHPRAKSP